MLYFRSKKQATANQTFQLITINLKKNNIYHFLPSAHMSPSEVQALWKEVSASSGIAEREQRERERERDRDDAKAATTTSTSTSVSSVVGSHARPIMNGVPPEGALLHPSGFLMSPHGIL